MKARQSKCLVIVLGHRLPTKKLVAFRSRIETHGETDGPASLSVPFANRPHVHIAALFSSFEDERSPMEIDGGRGFKE
jgi:hypothetical protein